MIRIRFPDAESERRALGFLLGRFSFKSWADGVTLLADYALPALAREGIPFLVEGPATYEQIIQAVRNPPASAV
jgi:spermidine/putrescine-binding protein